MVIDISGNHLRLMAFIEFNHNRIYVRHIVSHAEYDKLTEKYRKEKKAMNYSALKKTAHRLSDQVSFVVEIVDNDEYEHAVELMDELIDSYQLGSSPEADERNPQNYQS